MATKIKRTSTNKSAQVGQLAAMSTSHHLSRRQVEQSKNDAENDDEEPRIGTSPKVTFKRSLNEPKSVLRKRTTRSSATGTSSEEPQKRLRFQDLLQPLLFFGSVILLLCILINYTFVDILIFM